MGDPTDSVAALYRAFPYPAPIADIEAELALDHLEAGDPSWFAPLLWPEGRPRERLRILSAGCGTNQAATLAYTNPDSEVIGIDLSEASLAHEHVLKAKYGLANLALHRLDLRAAGELGGAFDVIICSGVLHHLADPAEGARALARMLAPHGVAALMLYGCGPRIGVYLLQEVFRTLGLEPDARSVALVRATLATLPPHHHAQAYVRGNKELVHDGAIADTFLHPADRAYWVSDVLDFVARSELRFQGWHDNNRYHPDELLAPDHPLRALVDRLPPEQQWAITEKLTVNNGRHLFLARRQDADPTPYTLAFAGTDWRAYAPVRHPLLRPGASEGGGTVYRRGLADVTISPDMAPLIEEADGRHSIAELLASVRMGEQIGRAFYEGMWRRGHMFFYTQPQR